MRGKGRRRSDESGGGDLKVKESLGDMGETSG